MTNLLKSNSYSILLLVISCMAALILSGCGKPSVDASNDVEIVEEQFIVTSVSENEIYGDLVESPNPIQAEGIYLDDSYYDIGLLSKVKVGDKIKVSYDKKDYEEENWDNILEVKIIK